MASYLAQVDKLFSAVSAVHKSRKDAQTERRDMSAPQFKDISTALALLTRLPVRAEFDRKSDASWAYPLAGTVIAILANIIAGLALWFGVDPALAAVIWIAAALVLTGAMHEDGLADTADGFWGGWDPAKRLEIMKDSLIGSYGVLALVLSVAARWAALWLLMAHSNWFWTMIAIETLSRAVMPALMHALPNARDTGLSHSQGQPTRETAALALAIGAAISLLMLGLYAIPLILLAGAAAALVGWLAKSKIGGQTGDVLGATQQITAITLLIALT